MAIRRFGVAIAGAALGGMHHVLMAGHILEGMGFKHPPEPFPTVMLLSLTGSAIIICCYLVPHILRINIALSKALLSVVTRLNQAIDCLIDRLRQILIKKVESLANWLRELTPPSDRNDPNN